VTTVAKLINAGADIDSDGGTYGTPLQAAAYGGNEMMVRVILGAKQRKIEDMQNNKMLMDIFINNVHGYYGTAPQAAACAGNTRIVALLLEKGAQCGETESHYGTPLRAAASNGHTDIVKI
jgi:ankyrin repeat protein